MCGCLCLYLHISPLSHRHTYAIYEYNSSPCLPCKNLLSLLPYHLSLLFYNHLHITYSLSIYIFSTKLFYVHCTSNICLMSLFTNYTLIISYSPFFTCLIPFIFLLFPTSLLTILKAPWETMSFRLEEGLRLRYIKYWQKFTS